ncbi:MAG: phenylalanine--tRNA ligase subunit alpha [Candidatus Pacebacteria bacterium]|nr:phenylalanine--tRNA ligase subunit alpha [Candidatus Paceibacterota bacterium]MCF7862946.1 phenylalanine--tRNA ligase subunit alpha [Candidatus Paceibacterota bacterium]
MQNKKTTEHPFSILSRQAYEVFAQLGFEIVVGPELETEWYNFDALNVPKDHPARDMQDTFWIKDSVGKVLRTHTTCTAGRAIERALKEDRFPSAFISVGKVFRNEATDATHEMQFFQIDGIMVGEKKDGISLANLKGVLSQFYKKMLGEEIEVEFRPSFFPFTEPSLEVHTKWKGKWLEMMGAGMLHPKVLQNLGLDPEKYQGFAFGGGLDRIAMIKWGVPDVRIFYQGDLRLNQF